jgi:threonine dehydrogenase-like Zn-dependent dehydrogenase
VIDAVGIDACRPAAGPAAKKSEKESAEFERELSQVAPKAKRTGRNWMPGDAPAQALMWEVEAIDKAGTLSIIGSYPQTLQTFPIGKAMSKNLTIKMGDCPHRRYIPILLEAVENGTVDPSKILTQIEPITNVVDAYRSFDEHQPGWIKVELQPEKVRVEV